MIVVRLKNNIGKKVDGEIRRYITAILGENKIRAIVYEVEIYRKAVTETYKSAKIY